MEIQSQFFATCQRTRKPARIHQLGSTTPRKATARDSFMGNAPETTRTSSTRKENADMLADGLQGLMCPKRRKETTIGLIKPSKIGTWGIHLSLSLSLRDNWGTNIIYYGKIINVIWLQIFFSGFMSILPNVALSLNYLQHQGTWKKVCHFLSDPGPIIVYPCQ